MKLKIFLFSILMVVLIFSHLMGFAQEKVDTGSIGLESTGNTNENSEEMGIDKGEFVYREQGRRDPFLDLLAGKNNKHKKEAREGIESLEIEQLALEGIINNKGKYIALFKGPDNKPYDVQVGQNVYDGEIIEINANNVVFKKILAVALGGTKEKTVVIQLNPEQENEQ